MKTVTLGKSGLVVTKPAMGCLPVQRRNMEDAVELLRAAYDGGIRYFDTANAYTDSEEKIGQALSDVRGDIIISTKGASDDAEEITGLIETSLRRMKTDYIDLYQLHCYSRPMTADDAVYQALLRAKEKGQIRHIGITAHSLEMAFEYVNSGLFETMQYPFSYLSTERELELVELCREKNVGFIAMKGLAGGLLTNSRACAAFMEQYDHVAPIWGIQTMDELKQWLALGENPPAMDDELRAFIAEDKKALSGSFCRGCGYCMPCPVGIEINNSARMDMLLRRSPWRGYMTPEWQEKMSRIENCLHCNQCSSKCPYGLDTPSLLAYNLKDYRQFYEEHKDQI
jgi:predicted aldo/keto reductase-like oxidoreductase